DLAFLQERAKRIGYEVFVDDKQLYFRKPKGKRGEVQLEWGVTMRRFQPRLTLSHQVNEVIVKGLDPVAKREVVGNATESDLSAPIGMDGDGGQLASKACSPAKQIVVRRPVTSQREAEAIAQSVLDEINAEFVEAEGIAWGNPQILAGTKIKIIKV